ncbi:TIGR03088 family PEP-CTERM/XrtA system glycosyltransferase [Rheinheimera nanhaiensis]|uniref:Phosphatidylinositol glycan, class A n=1 Tax=Rheinheimera nanhaiensis E407-8 TaxID=562729 RepID=I1E1J1_9GAMM|nr:TIGR03088 family PEP-CTERM/XrtA system glycosyltransferase [Rheinheimera nanhaiensis]GAB60169.1 phosphatidylinositol glycan, class A [Rheinheimera nanhaiensis E407-8]
MTEQPPVHIAHLIWHFSTGGLENGVVNLINHLPAGQFRHSIITLSGHDPKFATRITTGNVRFYCLDKAPGHDWGTFSRLNQLLKQLKPDVLHSRNLATLELQTVGWWRKVPLRLHGEHGWDSTDIGGSSKKNQLIRRLFQRFVNHFICLSAESEQYLRNKIGISAARLSRICNGVDVERFAAAAPVQLWPHSQSIAPVLFVSVGRLATVKNHALLLRAFALLLQQAPQFSGTARLVLVGDGPCRAVLEQQSQALGISDKVHFSGERQDITSVMQAADVFVLPSLAEGISNTLLEAMAAGTPVIATAVGGNPDLLPPALCHTNLVPSGDAQALMQAMLRYLKQPQALKTDAELVKNHCHQHFSIDTMVNRYRRIYDITRTQR